MNLRIMPVALVVAVIVLVAGGGAALAMGIGVGGDRPSDNVLGRVAEDLGVASTDLQDAFDQAHSEAMHQHLRDTLDRLVETGLITADEADELSGWVAEMPPAAVNLMDPRAAGPMLADIAGQALNSNGVHRRSAGIIHGDQDRIIERAAEILGLSADSVRESLQEARDAEAAERREQFIEEMIARLVEAGTITQAEGSEIEAWIEAMPSWLEEKPVMHAVMSGRFGVMLPFLSPHGVSRSGEFHGEGALPRFLPAPGDDRWFDMPRFMNPKLYPNPSQAPLERRPFFFREPAREFEFDGELPPGIDDMFRHFQDQFRDMDELFERFHVPALPTPSTEGVEPNGLRDS